MPLTGPQLGRIHRAILDAFEREELQRLLYFCMDVELDDVASGADFSAQVFALVRWADRRKRILDLVRCAHEDRPGDAELAAIHADAQSWFAPPAAPPAPPAAALPAAAPPTAAPPVVLPAAAAPAKRRGGWIAGALGAVALLAVVLLVWQPWRPAPGAATPTPDAALLAAAAAPAAALTEAPTEALTEAPTQTPTKASTPKPTATATATPPPTVTGAAVAQAATAADSGATATATPTPTPTQTPLGRPPANGAGVVAKLWKPGQTLRIRFLDGDPQVQERVAAVAQEWTQYANLTFAFGDDPDAEIRIAFDPNSSWTATGTDALTVPRNKATMNLGDLTAGTDEETFRWKVLREFGFALGLIYEELNPNADIPWDEAAAIAAYGEYGMSEESVRELTLGEYPPEDLAVPKPFDPESVMMSIVTNELTVGDYEIAGYNSELSALDKQSIAEIYPPAPAATATPTRAATATRTPTPVAATAAAESGALAAAAIRADRIRLTQPTLDEQFNRDSGAWDVYSNEAASVEIARRTLNYSVVNAQTYNRTRAMNTSAGDLLYEADATQRAGPENAEIGVAVRGSSLETGESYYNLVINAKGQYAFWAMVDGAWTELVPWTPSEALATGLDATNRLGLLAEGSTITFFANGEPLAQVEDDAVAEAGWVGLSLGTFDTGGAEVTFDNVKLWALD